MTSADQFVVTDDGEPGRARLALGGRITVACAAQFRAAALDLVAGGRPVRVCCAAVEYFDAAALQVLVGLGRELHGRGLRFDVDDVPPALSDLLRLAGVGAA
jgi:anti-anti-sigma factor